MRSLIDRCVPILLYHSVSDSASASFAPWTVPPRTFQWQMRYLRSAQFTPLTVSEYATIVRNGGWALPRLPVVITFDDGFRDFYDSAAPVLTELGFQATLYVVTGCIGGTSRWLASEGEGDRSMLTWTQVRDLSANGIELGAHTVHHPQLDVVKPASAWQELTHSKADLEDAIGRSVSSFAYPHGYYDKRVRSMVGDAGYASACGVKHVMSGTADDLLALGRIMVTRDVDHGRFEALVEGRGLRVAPVGERLRTRLWRLARRSTARLRRQTS
jgi:peptidoglycan/xylan/chitin deacetylase (PgdA/CDA1 family)